MGWFIRSCEFSLVFLQSQFIIAIANSSRCDIEQEVNGLYSYDRKEKVPVARIKAIMDAAKDHYYQHVGVQTHGVKGWKKLLEQGKHMIHR